jgi:hypothetical protein
MSLFGSPSPQWADLGAFVVAPASRLIPFLDPSGFWVLLDAPSLASGAFVTDPSGFTVIDDTVTVGLKPTLMPSGTIVIY